MHALSYAIGLAALCLLGQVNAHSNLQKVTSQVDSGVNSSGPRGNLDHYGYCGAGENCKGPCDNAKSAVDWNYNKPTFKRGGQLTLEWLRQNHPGGFVRFAIVPFEESDSWDAFNNNIVGGSCYESNCGATDQSNLNFWGPLTGSGSGQCTTTITIPENLADGKWTLQWAWFGGGIVFGEKDTVFGDFYSCTDFNVKGGAALVSEKPAIQWNGGDIMEPNSDTCRYWGTNTVGKCRYDGQAPANPNAASEADRTLDPCMHNVQPTRGKPSFVDGSAVSGPSSPQALSTNEPTETSDTLSGPGDNNNAAPPIHTASGNAPAPITGDHVRGGLGSKCKRKCTKRCAAKPLV
ncbi:hypothetical protein H4R35_005274 [Dimargaris xerosporica]|nr:hypothetical protein H4R35_005274 [Dimargaris xerosporica]